MATGATNVQISELPRQFNFLSVSRDTAWIAAASNTSMVVWDRLQKKTIARFDTQNLPVRHAFSPDRRFMVILEEHAISFRDCSTWAETIRHNIPGAMGGDIAFGRSTNIVATGSTDGFIRLWDFAGKKLAELPGSHLAINSISFSPDNRTFIIGTSTGLATFFNLETLRDVGNLENAYRVGFAPNGDLFLLNFLTMTLKVIPIPTHLDIQTRLASRIRVFD